MQFLLPVFSDLKLFQQNLAFKESFLTHFNHVYFVFLQDIYHERAWLHSRVDQVMVKCVVETTGQDHSEKMLKFLEERGYPLIRDN
jgi:hypothetical protein